MVVVSGAEGRVNATATCLASSCSNRALTSCQIARAYPVSPGCQAVLDGRQPGRTWGIPWGADEWFAGLTGSGVRWRGRLLGPAPTSQSSALPGPVVSTTFFGCCPDGLYVSAPARPAPPNSSLISFGNFPPLPLRVDRPPSATAPQASPAAKTTRERRRWPIT